MNCPKCGAEVVEGTKFCPKCGADLQGIQPQQPMNDMQQQPGVQPMQQPVMPENGLPSAGVMPGAAQTNLPSNSMGIASFICGLLGFLCCTYLGIPGVICGVLGLQNAKAGKVSSKDLWMCYAGIVLGAIGILMLILNIIGIGPSSWFNN